MAVRDRISRTARRVIPARTRVSHPGSRAPWWVRALTTVGRPVVATVVLIMCAPGEHHLAVLAGWDTRLAWGMAAVLAAYAGIAAAVASARPAGAPGKKSAIAGAFTSLTAAMAAQPVSHAFVTGHLTAEPRTPLWLVIAVSCVPPLVLGHLLHLAATPVTAPATQPAELDRAAPEQPAETTTCDAETTEQHPGPDPAPAETQPETSEQRDEQRFLTTKEVADRYGVKASTIGTWKDRGKVRPALTDPRLGNLYDPDDLPSLASLG